MMNISPFSFKSLLPLQKNRVDEINDEHLIVVKKKILAPAFLKESIFI